MTPARGGAPQAPFRGACVAQSSRSPPRPRVAGHLGCPRRHPESRPTAQRRVAAASPGRVRRRSPARRPPSPRLGRQSGRPPEAAFAGLTAVALWGGREFASADDAVEIVVPHGVRWQPGPGVVVRTSTLDGDVVHDPPRLRRTGRARTAVDLIRRAEPDDGVVLLDRLVNSGVVRLDAVRDAVAELSRGRGTRRARKIAALADGLAESAPETGSGC